MALDLGATRFLVKPLDMKDLLHEIENALAKPVVARDSSGQEQDKGILEKGHLEAVSRKLNKKVQELEEEHVRLAKSAEKYKRLIETIGGEYFFYTRDSDGKFTYVSPSITEVLGYLPEEFAGHYTKCIMEGPTTKEIQRCSTLGSTGGKQLPHEVEMYHHDGSVRRLEVTEYRVVDKEGKVVGGEGIVHDITAHVEADQEREALGQQLRQAQKMEAIGTLSGGIAHDFNNILTPIIGYTEMTIYNLPEGSGDRQNLEEVLCAAGRAKSLVKQILTFSRHSTQERSPVQLHSIIKEILKLLRSSIPATIEIKETIDTQCGPVLANQTQIHQLLMNLCTNASQAMREKGGVLGVSLNEVQLESDDYVTNLELPAGRYIRLEVSDTGGGIELEDQERVFDPYFTTKAKDEGTGLGLSVVHGIVKSHGGHITLYSEPGRGTTFHVYFPRIQSSIENGNQSVVEELSGGSETIMVVDDEPVIARMIAEILQRLGYQVVIMVSAQDALQEFRNSSTEINLLITDMTMPIMTGAELAKEVMAIRPEIPVILCSGFSEIINKEKAEALGIREYLMKPVSRNDLARSVRRVLDQS